MEKQFTKYLLTGFILSIGVGAQIFIQENNLNRACLETMTTDQLGDERRGFRPEPFWLDGDANYCDVNSYDCSDFCTQEDAQKMLEACVWSDDPDIHKLDRDRNGIACETLP